MDIIGIHAEGTPDKVAVIDGERQVTWKELRDLRNRVANSLLGLGVEQGSHVVVYSLNSLEVILSSAGARVLDCISTPMNHRLVAEEVTYILDDSDATCVFVGDSFIPTIEQVRPGATKVRHWVLIGKERRDWAVALEDLIANGSPEAPPVPDQEGIGGSMIYTAGTTGKPKGSLRTQSDPQIALGWLQQLDLLDTNHIHLVAGPMYHSAPAAFALFTQLVGGTLVVMHKFDPEQALELIEKHWCTSTFMAPTLLKRILDLPKEVREGYDVSSMRALVVAGAPCPMKVKEDAVSFFGPVLYEFYGSTELSINAILRPEDILRKPGSCGKVAPGIELAILDDNGNPVPAGEPGELHVRRYVGMFDEYYKKPEATKETARGDWVSVGDIAYIDEEGFLYICDRKRDMIISGGVNIYPAEIEDLLHRHPKIRDVAVFGVPDEEWGERVHAAVQLQPNQTMTEQEIVEFARQHLAGYKVPREITFHDDFPRDTAGKLLKRVLRDPYWAGRKSRV